MCLIKMMVADTPTVVKYEVTKEGIRVRQIVGLNPHPANGRKFCGRRVISISTDTRYDIAKVIGAEITAINKGSVLR